MLFHVPLCRTTSEASFDGEEALAWCWPHVFHRRPSAGHIRQRHLGRDLGCQGAFGHVLDPAVQ